MDVISIRDVEALSRILDAICLSVYLPTFRSGQEVQQNSIRFKNMLARAADMLREQGLKGRQVTDLLSPMSRLQMDKYFWEHQMAGLALYRTPRRFFSFCAPVMFEEEVVVARRLHLKPLFALFGGNGRFHMLALGRRSARLYMGTRYSVLENLFPRLPAGAEPGPGRGRALRQLQLHTTAGPGTTRPGVFHGQGNEKEREKDEIMRYYRRVDRVVKKILRDERTPVVLVGLQNLCAIYQAVSSLPTLMQSWVDANAESMSAQQLHTTAWKMVEPSFKVFEKEKVQSFHAQYPSGKSSNLLTEIVPAAVYKRVDTLFLASGHHEWGHFDRSTGSVSFRGEERGREDLMDLAAVHTLKNRGTVLVMSPGEVPGGSAYAALFRF